MIKQSVADARVEERVRLGDPDATEDLERRGGERARYGRFVDEACRVLRRDGVMVLLTSARQALLEVLRQRGLEAVLHEVLVLGQKAFIFVIRPARTAA